MQESFERPVFIIASPRSGSTLLYETLAKHPEFVSLHAESHAVIEHVPELSTVARGLISNCLGAEDATDGIRETLTSRFLALAKNHDGSAYLGRKQRVRFLEKTPKNALRVPFLHALYPDARFVFLVRQPVPNIASIMEAWGSGRFITYPQLPGWRGPWSLLLPPGWQSLSGDSVAEVAAFQWQQANLQAVDAFKSVPHSQVLSVNYDDFCARPKEVINQICDFADISQTALDVNTLPLSRYTLSAPSETKWHLHAAAIQRVVDSLDKTIAEVNACIQRDNASLVSVTPELGSVAEQREVTSSESALSEGNTRRNSVQRNAPCPCGSGKRFKQCHGKLS